MLLQSLFPRGINKVNCVLCIWTRLLLRGTTASYTHPAADNATHNRRNNGTPLATRKPFTMLHAKRTPTMLHILLRPMPHTMLLTLLHRRLYKMLHSLLHSCKLVAILRYTLGHCDLIVLFSPWREWTGRGEPEQEEAQQHELGSDLDSLSLLTPYLSRPYVCALLPLPVRALSPCPLSRRTCLGSVCLPLPRWPRSLPV